MGRSFSGAGGHRHLLGLLPFFFFFWGGGGGCFVLDVDDVGGLKVFLWKFWSVSLEVLESFFGSFGVFLGGSSGFDFVFFSETFWYLYCRMSTVQTFGLLLLKFPQLDRPIESIDTWLIETTETHPSLGLYKD